MDIGRETSGIGMGIETKVRMDMRIRIEIHIEIRVEVVMGIRVEVDIEIRVEVDMEEERTGIRGVERTVVKEGMRESRVGRREEEREMDMTIMEETEIEGKTEGAKATKGEMIVDMRRGKDIKQIKGEIKKGKKEEQKERGRQLRPADTADRNGTALRIAPGTGGGL
jgi:hypothetical protein